MSEWIKKLIGIHTCFNCESTVNKKDIYSVDIDTADGPLHLKLCQNCADDFDNMLKDLEENLNGQRNNTF
jgi:hypothetical protein